MTAKMVILKKSTFDAFTAVSLSQSVSRQIEKNGKNTRSKKMETGGEIYLKYPKTLLEICQFHVL